MIKNKEKLQNGLRNLGVGMVKASHIFYYGTAESELLSEIINSGVGDGYTQDKYCDLFEHSFDELGELIYDYVEQFVEEVLEEEWEDDFFEVANSSEHVYKKLIIGLDMAVEGLEEVLEVCKADKEWKEKLKKFQSDREYSPFENYGFSVFLKKLKGFKRAYIAELTRQVGKRPLKKILDGAL